jgi:hypothetical protein
MPPSKVARRDNEVYIFSGAAKLADVPVPGAEGVWQRVHDWMPGCDGVRLEELGTGGPGRHGSRRGHQGLHEAQGKFVLCRARTKLLETLNKALSILSETEQY